MDQIETYTKQDNLIIHGLPADYAEVLTAPTTDGAADAVMSERENSTMTEVLFMKFCADRLGVNICHEDIYQSVIDLRNSTLYSIHQSLSDLLAAKRVQLFWLQEINFDHREVSAMHLQQFQYTSMNI